MIRYIPSLDSFSISDKKGAYGLNHSLPLLALLPTLIFICLILLPTTAVAQEMSPTPPPPTLEPEIACLVDSNPVWSPDSQRIAFVSGRSGNPDIWIMDADGTNLQNITNTSEISEYNLLWSPDGNWFVFLSGPFGIANIWVVRPDGTDLLNLSEGDVGPAASPAWSPDGEYLAIPSLQGGVWVVNMETFERINITAASDEAYKWPSWSPDGQQIALTTYDNDDVLIANVDGSGIAILNDTKFNIRAHWSPVNQFILVIHATTLGGSMEDLWLIDSDTFEVVNLTEHYDGDYFWPTWSPDGNMIIFQSNLDGRNNIWRMDTDGGNLLNLTSEIVGSVGLVAWSPDGQKVAFRVRHESTHTIWVVDADGTNPINLSAVIPCTE